MIFVTVGTHEDGMDRLMAEVDRLVEVGELRDELVVQAGYSELRPRGARVEAMMPFDEVQEAMRRAEVVITHGGPASIMQALSFGKTPVVVPRQARFGEHVDDHQVRFARRIADRVLVVTDIAELGPAVARARALAAAPHEASDAPAARFAGRFDALCEELLREGGGPRGVLRWPR